MAMDSVPVKRQKVTTVAPAVSAVASGSTIFAPFRTVGLVSPTGVPFTSVPLGKTSFQITTSVGRCLQTYDVKRGLHLVFVTRPQTPADITATFAWKQKVFAAWGADGVQGVWVYKRGKRVGELAMPTDLAEPITQLLVFGTWIVGLATTRIEVWRTATSEHYTTLTTGASAVEGGRRLVSVCTMPTFLNKIFVGRADGWVDIWNVSAGKLVYTIVPPATATPPGGVTCLEPTPALGLLAIAYASGAVVVHDVLRDQPLVYVEAGTTGVALAADGSVEPCVAPVTTMSFRTDGRGAGPDGRSDGVMATATTGSGDVTFWDLNKGGRIMGVLRSAHNPPSQAGQAGQSDGGISRVQFLPGQPVLVSSGRDNALRTWIFDATPFAPVPRILHTRSGHAAPVSCLAFVPSDFDGADAGNKWLLSGGLDRSLWGWSLRRDGQSTELSQGRVRARAKKTGVLSSAALRMGGSGMGGAPTLLEDLKAPPITCIASSMNRDGGVGALPGKLPQWIRVGPRGTADQRRKAGDLLRPQDTESAGATGWESVVTAHRGDAFARTWFWGRKRAGRWALGTGDGALVSTVAVSPCGSFALVGSAAGAVDAYNLQSGLHRQRFPSRLTPAQARQLKVQQQLRQADGAAQFQATATVASPGQGRHTAAVTGIVVDNLGSTVVTCSLDGTVKFWDFLTGHLRAQMGGGDDPAWGGVAITACRYHAANDLAAFACADNGIRVVDLATKKVIRHLRTGSTFPASSINDLCFSNDGRWVVAVTQHDRRLRVWDLPTSHLVDTIQLDRAGRAVAFSGTGEYLAVAPDGALGVHLWTNTTLFRHVPTRPVCEPTDPTDDPAPTAAPTVSGEGGRGLLAAAFDDAPDEVDDADDIPPGQSDQLSADMATLSLVPRARWQTLLHLDLIKQRNRPKEAPKAPEKAPFFLGTIASGDAEETALARISTDQSSAAGSTGPDGRARILALDRTRNQHALTAKLHRGPTDGFAAFVDHLKDLPAAQADMELRSLAPADGELALFVRALTARLRARRDYELVQAWMAVFLRIHGSVVATATDDDDADALDDLAAALAEWRRVQDAERARLDALVGYCSGVVAFLRNPRT